MAGCFDVTMGSYDDDSPEVWKLGGTFILSKLENIGKKNIGCYCDNRLVVLRNMNPPRTDKMKKIIIKMFKRLDSNLKTNLKKVEFLHIMSNLINGLYAPCKKSNDNLLYINTSSDQPPQIIKQLVNSINKRLCENLANERVFTTVKAVYENA